MSGLGRFDSNYVVPNQDLPETGQLLYYFIGLTNFYDNNETIIQPVLAFCGSGSCGYSYDYSGWEMAAWNCCPSGLTNYGKGIQLEKGENITTFVYSDPSTGNVEIYMNARGGVSSLNERGDYRAFNDAEITGEFYSFSSCGQFNNLPVQFNDMSVQDVNGQNVEILPTQWQTVNYNPLECGGSINIEDAARATISAAK